MLDTVREKDRESYISKERKGALLPLFNIIKNRLFILNSLFLVCEN